MKKLLLVPGFALAGLMSAGNVFAQAAAIDVTAATTQITAANAPIGLIGVGVLTVVAILATWKWVRRAF